jgi:hypothetical protein
MRRLRINVTAELLWQCAEAIVLVLFLSVPVFLIGREALGETVIALLYLAIVAWSACRWDQCAAVMATPAFNFLFIPPFFAFAMRQLEGWLGSRSSSAYPLSSSAGSRMRLRRRASVKGMHASYMSSGLRWGGSARTRPCCMPWLLGTCQTFVAASVQVALEAEPASFPAVVKVSIDAYIAQPPDCVMSISGGAGSDWRNPHLAREWVAALFG